MFGFSRRDRVLKVVAKKVEEIKEIIALRNHLRAEEKTCREIGRIEVAKMCAIGADAIEWWLRNSVDPSL